MLMRRKKLVRSFYALLYIKNGYKKQSKKKINVNQQQNNKNKTNNKYKD